MQVSGVPLAACQAMSVTRVGFGRVGAPHDNRQGATIAQPVPGPPAQSRDTATGTAEHGRTGAVAWRHHTAGPGPATAVTRHHHRAAGPRRAGSGSGTLFSSGQEHRRVKVIRPFPPWPCGPFP